MYVFFPLKIWIYIGPLVLITFKSTVVLSLRFENGLDLSPAVMETDMRPGLLFSVARGQKFVKVTGSEKTNST